MSCIARRLDPAIMEEAYKINPPRHAEAAYQPHQGDQYPTLSTVPTTAGPSGEIILLVTTLYNKPIFNRAEAEVVDYDSLVKAGGGTFPAPDKANAYITQHPDIVVGHCAEMTPFYGIIYAQPNSRVTVRVLTGGMKAKALSRESFNAMGGVL
ncbi:MAG: hypothetical protein ACJ74T_11845 [Pyrinomonadaceae bacterium]